MSSPEQLYRLLKRPIITEKTNQLSQYSQYVFEVDRRANKIELSKAFELAFPGRQVSRVRLITIPATTRRVGRHSGRTAPRRKAIFTITGDPIELFAGV